MVSDPLVSIGLPVYNGEDFVLEALQSLAGQTHRNVEIVVSDNASQDATPDIVREFAARDGRVRYARQPKNMGVIENLRAVAERSRGDYFMWAAHDDLWDPAYVETLLGEFRVDPGIGLAFSDYDWVDEKGRAIRAGGVHPGLSRFARALTFGASNGRLRNMCLHYLTRNPFLIVGLFKTATVRAALPMEDLFPECMHFDTVFLMKVLARERVAAVDRVLYHYRARARDADEIRATHRPEREDDGRTPRARVDAILRGRALDIARESGFSTAESALLRVVLPGLDSARALREALGRRLARRAG